MTKYITLLKQQRQYLVSRSQCATHLESMLQRYTVSRHSSQRVLATRSRVAKIDQQIYLESKQFGDLRFKVIGTYGR